MKALPKGMTFNSSSYINQILGSLLDWYRIEFDGTHRRLIIHAYNACPHTARVFSQFCKDTEITYTPHPPDSPDLAASDFDRFVFIKNGLRGMVYEEADDLLGAIGAILWEVKCDTLERIFRHWMLKIEARISGNSGYAI
jgi:hypothetical protein